MSLLSLFGSLKKLLVKMGAISFFAAEVGF
jgi:hypothetical protein